MRPSSHLLRSIPSSISANPFQTLSSICPSCLHLLSALPRTGAPSSRPQPPFQRRHASNSPWIEKYRRRIWGVKEGEVPPGPEDPYGGESILQKRQRIRKEAQARLEGPLLEKRKQEREDLGLEVVEEGARWDGSAQEQGYRPATTWDGLEHVGVTGQWWEMPVVEGETVVPYMTRPKLTSREDLLCAVHRAMVEVSTLQAVKRKLTYSSRPDMAESTEMADLIRHVEIGITKGEKGEMSFALAYPGDEAKNLILESMKPVKEDMRGTENEVEAPEQDIFPNEKEAGSQDAQTNATKMSDEVAILEELRRSVEEEESLKSTAVATSPSTQPISPIDESFLALPLTDPKVKFAILKRVTQLSSNLIPDHTLPRITTLSALLSQLLSVAAPPPKTVNEILTASLPPPSQFQSATSLPPTVRIPNPATNQLKSSNVPPLAHLPNVTIHARRQTSIDRHKEVGRWKVIEEELRKRGLPVTGRREDGRPDVLRDGKGRRVRY